MSRVSAYFLVTCFAFVAWSGRSPVSAMPLCASSAWALPSDDYDRETEKYNRKLYKLEAKRAKDLQKLEEDYRKLFKRKKSMDVLKLQDRLDEFQRKRDKVEEKYRTEVLKLERERARKQ